MPLCVKCDIWMDSIRNVVNTHSYTGDPKYIGLYKCSHCGKAALLISVCANTWEGESRLGFRIDLTDEEMIEISELMSTCPDPTNQDCKCPVHKKLDTFEMQDSSKRQKVQDEYVPW